MAKAFNFNTIKKEFFTITLPDKKKTTLMISTPTKEIMDDLQNLKNSLKEDPDVEGNTQVLDDLYDTIARIMTRNKGGITVTKKDLEAILDVTDLIYFFNAYVSFIEEVANSKN